MRSFFKIFSVFAFTSVLVASSLVSYDYFKSREAFPQKTYIGAVDFSGLTQKQAVSKLKAIPLSQIYTSLITFESDNRALSFPPEKLGIHVLPDETIKNAFALTHKGNYLRDLKERMTKSRFKAPLILGIDEEETKTVFEVIASKTNSSAKNATIVFYEKTYGFNIKPEELGRELDVVKSLAAFKTALYNGEKIVKLAIDYDYPSIRENDLRAHPPTHRLAAYTTYYGSHDSRNRIHNIKLVASWIDGTLLMPGDTFSVVDILGDVTEEQGFKEAFVIVKGELDPQLGGGSCQIATTLCNTVALADLKVLKRKNHSFYFNIYPLGRDAGVYPDQLDFKFENDTKYPIVIKAVANNRRLSFRIYGTDNGKKVKFSGAGVYGKTEKGFVPMSLKHVINKDIPFRTKVKRRVFKKDSGKLLKEETITSYYKLYGDKENVPIKRPEPR